MLNAWYKLQPMKMLSLAIGLLLCFSAFAQMDTPYEDGVYAWGFKGGATYHRIDEVATTIIPPFFSPDTYSTSVEPQLGYVGGIFFHYRFGGVSRIALQPEILYGLLSSRFSYSDVDELEYQIDFNYQYLQVGTFVKVYLTGDREGGLQLNGGLQLAFNTSNEQIYYDSNRPDIGPNLQIQQNLRNVLKGETLLNLGAGLGYDFVGGLSISARYFYGLSDAIETQANGYFFIENDNPTQTFQLSLAYAIPFR